MTQKLKSIVNVLFKDPVWYYTFLILLLKSIVFVGVTLDTSHNIVQYRDAVGIFSSHKTFYIGFVVFLLSFAFLFKGRSRLWYLILTNTLASALLFGEMLYFRGFNTMPTFYVFQQGANLNGMSETVMGLMRGIDIVFLFDIPVMILGVLIWRKLYKGIKRNCISFAVFFIISILLVAYMPIYNSIQTNVFGKRHIPAIVYIYDSSVTNNNLSPIGYNLYSVYAFIRDSQPLVLSAEEKSEIKQWFDEKKEDLPDNKYKGMFKGKNLIIVQIESLENFVINRKVDGQEITPNINRLLNNSLYFSNFHEQVNEGNSSDAELLCNTSVFPLLRDSAFFRYPNTAYNSLPKLMKGLGYNTMDIHADPGSFWNWRVAMTSAGFDKCIDGASFTVDEEIGLGLSDGSFLRQVVPMLSQQKQPFYSYMVTLSNHTPFNLPWRYRELTLKGNLGSSILGGYFQSVRYTDRQIGNFIKDLDKSGLLDNSIVVMFGDHEGIHKYFPKDPAAVEPREDWWLDNNKEVPFIIYSKNMQGQEFKTHGGEVDILPTVSYILGVEEEKYIDTAMGRSLLKTEKDYSVLQTKICVGENLTDKEKEHGLKGLELADKIIRSNYFKEMLEK